MQKTLKAILIAMGICVGLASMCLADETPLTAEELLNKYTATQKKLQSSFIIKSESITDNPEESGDVSETRYDGSRISWVKRHWGSTSFYGGKEHLNTKGKPAYLFYMFDGQHTYSHFRGSDRTGTVLINSEIKPKRNTLDNSPEKYFAGYCYGNYDRIDQVLRRYNNAGLNPNMKKIGNNNCYHISAVTKEGTFNIWICPELNYNIVKMNASYKQGDIFYEVPVPETGKIIWQVEIIDFKQVDGLWVPMEYKEKLNRRIPARYHKITEQSRRRRTNVTLNPDHEKLCSFGTDFIPNGAKTYMVSIDPDYRYIWQDGALIDGNGNKVDLEKIVSETKNAEK